MSTLIEDNKEFLKKYGFDQDEFTRNKLEFRNDLLIEEFNEIQEALETKNPEEWVDGHIDILVIALGNLHLAGVDVKKAWKQVHNANMTKVRGVKPGREQSGGTDVYKPAGWKSPSHKGNHGKLTTIFTEA